MYLWAPFMWISTLVKAIADEQYLSWNHCRSKKPECWYLWKFLKLPKERCKLLIRYISWQYVFYRIKNLNIYPACFILVSLELQHRIYICNTCCFHPRIVDCLAFYHFQSIGIHTLPSPGCLIWISSKGSSEIILEPRLNYQGCELSN